MATEIDNYEREKAMKPKINSTNFGSITLKVRPMSTISLYLRMGRQKNAGKSFRKKYMEPPTKFHLPRLNIFMTREQGS